jgi:hypothetical protein
MPLQLAGTKLDAKFTQMIGTSTAENSGDHAFAFEAYVVSCDLTGGVEDQATYSVSLEVVGTITYAAIS